MSVDLDRPLNRVSLGAIVDFFIDSDEAWADTAPVADHLHRLSELAGLRNKGLAGHGFQGIGREDLEATFGGDPDGIVPHLDETYQLMFDRPLPSSPYEAVNGLLVELIHE